MTRRYLAFVLLEVTVAVVILAIVLGTVMRGFVIALHSIRENRIVQTAAYLADSLLEDYELEPPIEGNAEGTFSEDSRFSEGFEHYTWEREVEEIEVDYDDVPRKTLQDPEPLYQMKLRVIYDDGERRRFVPIQLTTYLLESQLYTDEALQGNQLF